MPESQVTEIGIPARSGEETPQSQALKESATMPNAPKSISPRDQARDAIKYLELAFIDDSDICYADLEACEFCLAVIKDCIRRIKHGPIDVTPPEAEPERAGSILRLQE